MTIHYYSILFDFSRFTIVLETFRTIDLRSFFQFARALCHLDRSLNKCWSLVLIFSQVCAPAVPDASGAGSVQHRRGYPLRWILTRRGAPLLALECSRMDLKADHILRSEKLWASFCDLEHDLYTKNKKNTHKVSRKSMAFFRLFLNSWAVFNTEGSMTRRFSITTNI